MRATVSRVVINKSVWQITAAKIMLLLVLLGAALVQAALPEPANTGGSYIFTAPSGERLRITPYGAAIMRVQHVRAGEQLLPDTHYEMVERHNWPREFKLQDKAAYWQLTHSDKKTLQIRIAKKTLAVSFVQDQNLVLTEQRSWWRGNHMGVDFTADKKEHFTGLGHSFYGREASIDLRGKVVGRNYGTEPIQQAPLIVPFYLSSKGYGVFLNSTFTNQFSFAARNKINGKYNYGMELDDAGFGGQLDYFFIAGPDLKQVLNNYTQLTGRPRLPMKSIFGLQLSDKSHDHSSPAPSNALWWQEKINQHRTAGFPLDHVVNDNRWRAGGGKRCESRLEWDAERYPDPKAYAQWLTQQGLTSTLDINRCIAQFSKGWKTEFNILHPKNIEFSNSAPDLTNAEFRQWFWQTFYQQSLDPALAFPGDALWIDEFDEMGAAPAKMKLANGRHWAEMRNYWFFLIAKALVQEGWGQSALQNKRPFVWVRGMTAGAQRYASLWSGDTHPSYADMQTQIRAMQLAGLSGFPFWGHDAGGFYDWENNLGPDENLYAQWALAFSSFAPIWKPHGMGQSRWPLDRSAENQKNARYYAQLRYELMPYLYTAAHTAAATGVPMARPLLLDYPSDKKAWQFDLQYLWGDSLLVAPSADASQQKTLWLPPGKWFEFHSKKLVRGNKVITVSAPVGFLPLYVKQGAIIPRYNYSLATAFADKQHLLVDVYIGSDGNAELIEDDDRSEAYRKGELQRTRFAYSEKQKRLVISGAKGNYAGAPAMRSYDITFYGAAEGCWNIAGKPVQSNKVDGMIKFFVAPISIGQDIIVNPCKAE